MRWSRSCTPVGALVLLWVAAGCGGAAPVASVDERPARAPRAEPTPTADAGPDDPPDPLFPERKAGWDELDTAGQKAADQLAEQYIDYCSTGKTPRKAVAELIALAAASGATALPDETATPEAGAVFSWTRPGGDAALIVRVGSRPLTDGVRLMVASVDAPRIDLKQTPVYEEAGLAMLDTFFYGPVKWESWLVTPMALHLYAARPGSATGDLELIVGEADTDPVLSIPDLLPHLSRKVQRRSVVDSAERLDAVAASSRAAFGTFLSEHGIDERTFEDAEAYLVPAGRASFVGTDRGLVAGYGHSHRALAFAATVALLDETEPEHTSMVVLISKAQIGSKGSSGLAFVKTAMSRIIAALSEDGAETDALDTRRIYARSAALLSARIEAAERNKGIATNTRADDALPDSTRRAIDRMTSRGAQLQVTFDGSWQGDTRRLSALDMDTVGVALPTTGQGTPMELVSVLDLYSGYMAFRGWVSSR